MFPQYSSILQFLAVIYHSPKKEEYPEPPWDSLDQLSCPPLFLVQHVASISRFQKYLEAVVGHILSEVDSYVHYKSNTSSTSGIAKRASSYWYENIAHQGISAFGPSGYTVYRNVKDYGAKGPYSRYVEG